MYHFAICDDERITCSELEKILLQYGKNSNIDFEVDIFYSGEKLCEYLISDNYYDLIFLDIQLGTIDGIEVGDYIRNKLEDENTLIVYVSSQEQYAMKLFQIGTFEFIIKPISATLVEKVLYRAMKKINSVNQFFDYSIGKNYYRVKLSEIILFQSNLRKVQIVTLNNKIEFYGKLQEIVNRLPENIFMRVHNSFLININQVREYSYESIRMINGEDICISKQFRKSVRNKILNIRSAYDR